MLKFVEGFELVTTTSGLALKGVSYGAYGARSIVAGRNSGQALQSTSVIGSTGGKTPASTQQYPWSYFNIGANLSSGIVGFAFNGNSGSETNPRAFFSLLDTSGYVIFYLARSGNDILLYQPTNVTSTLPTATVNQGRANESISTNSSTTTTLSLKATSSGFTFSEATWYYLEIKFSLAATGGYVTINCNQQQVLTWTAGSFSTAPTGTTRTYNNVASRFGLGLGTILSWNTSPSNYSAQNNKFDDMYVVDLTGAQNNTFLGNVYMTKMIPSSTVAGGFTPVGAGTNHGCVSEADPNGLTNYVSTSTTGTTDVYGVTTTSQTGGVLGVSFNVCGQQVGGTGSVQPVAQVSSTNYFGTPITLNPGAFATSKQIMELNPATGTAWTQTTINATNFGVKYTTP